MDARSFISAKEHMSIVGPQIQAVLLHRRPSNMSYQTVMECSSVFEFLREINL